MLTPAADLVRLSLHITAATVWVGGQLTLAGLVPTLRQAAPAALPAAARQFARLAWPAYAVLVATGIWNLVAVHPSGQTEAWRGVLGAKVAVAIASGLTAWLHQRAKSTIGRAVLGALTSLSALGALVLGVALAG